jgi:iron(III) transport system substrate-binding protein
METMNQPGHRPGRRAFHRAALAALAAPMIARAQRGGADSTHKPLYMYQGADREARLLAEAKKQGQVVLYTSLNLKDSVPLTDAFEKKTGLKVQLWRASSEKVLQRAITEARAGRFSPDILETNGPEMEALYREQILEEFFSPHFTDLPAAAFPRHRHYVADRFNFFTIGYNTNLVKPEEVPNAYEDLVHPRWAGRVGMEGSDVDWFGAMVKSMGEEKGLAFFRKLAEMRPQIRTGHTLMAELVASGEIPLAATLYNHNVERLTVKGAPVKWKAVRPTFGRPNAIGVAKRAPHPHAAMLFVDYMLSKEGQTILKERNRVPASLSVDTHLNKFPFQMIDPVITLDENDRWEKLWSELFLKGKKIEKEAE